MLNIVIPMAGRGSRFAEKGYSLPKPLIPIHGVPMIRLVIENLKPTAPHRFIFLALEDHVTKFELDHLFRKWTQGQSEIVPVRETTEGAACTVLLAKQLINNNSPLMIANSDQWIQFDINNYLRKMESADADGLIMTMTASDPKWSFVKIDGGLVCEVAEKVPISNEATVGIYNFARGSDFVQAADRMIQRNLRVNNEFYVAPVYNELIKDGARIAFFNVGSEFKGMYGLGTPIDLEKFIANDVSLTATRRLEL